MIDWRSYQRSLGRPPADKPRLSLVPPSEKVEQRERRQASALVVLIVAAVFAGVAAWALWTKGIR